MTRSIGSIGGRLWLALGLAAASSGCADPGGAADDGPGAVETQVSAVEASSDRPVATAVAMNGSDGVARVWILTCDRSNNLVRTIYSPDGTFSAPEHFDAHCAAPPGFVPRTSTSGYLIEHASNDYLYMTLLNGSGRSGSWTNLANLSSFGQVAGTPVFTGVSSSSSFDIGVKSTTNQVATITYYFSGAYYSWVTTLGGLNVVSENSLAPGLAGRATRADDADDDMSWFAAPCTTNCGSRYHYIINAGAFTTTGNPAKARVGGQDYAVAPFGSTLKYWTPFAGDNSMKSFACTIGGSPMDPGMLPHGYVRGGRGDLVQWDISSGSCHSVSGRMTAAPSPVIPLSDNVGEMYRYDAVYRGTDGDLWYYNDAQRTHYDTGIAMP
jgi:hypothetical protein